MLFLHVVFLETKNINMKSSREERSVRFCPVNEMILGSANLDKELKTFVCIQPIEPARLSLGVSH